MQNDLDMAPDIRSLLYAGLLIALITIPISASALTIAMEQESFAWEILGPCGLTAPCGTDGLARTQYTLDFLDGYSDGSSTRLNFQTSLPLNDIWGGQFEGGYSLLFGVSVTGGCADPGWVGYQDTTMTACGTNGSFYVQTYTTHSNLAVLNWTNEIPGPTQFPFFLELDGIPTDMTINYWNSCPSPSYCDNTPMSLTTSVSAVPEPTSALLFVVGLTTVGSQLRRRKT